MLLTLNRLILYTIHVHIYRPVEALTEEWLAGKDKMSLDYKRKRREVCVRIHVYI